MRRAGPLPWLRPGVFVGALAPLGAILLRGSRGELGANPIAQALNQLGLVALIFLVAALACTPLKTFFGWTWPIRLRRMLGLFGFFYGLLHVSTYTVLDQGFDFGAIAKDVLKHKFIFLGMGTWLLLLPLAITSTQGWQRRLGFRRWKRLHRLVYLAGGLASFHFLLRFKTPRFETLAWMGVIGALLLVRAVEAARRRARVVESS